MSIDQDYFREKLLQERSRLKKVLGCVTDKLVIDCNKYDNKFKKQLDKVNKALSLLEKEEYGKCLICKRHISKDTLEKDPLTMYCPICILDKHITSI